MHDRRTANSVRTESLYLRHARRILGSLSAIASAIFLSALILPAPAMAQVGVLCSMTGNETGALSDDHYMVGEIAEVSGSGFAALCDLEVDIDQPDGSVDTTTVTTDAYGTFSFSHSPTALLGDRMVHFFGQDDAELMGMSFTVGPVLALDKGDYRSEETVHVTGLAFLSLADIIVQITRPDGSIVKSDGTPGSDTVVTDQFGDFAYDYVVRDGVMDQYKLDALDQYGNVLASTSFTDSGAFVKKIGDAAATNVSSLTIPATGGVAAGDSIIVAFETAGSTSGGVPAAGCSDGKNTYSLDVTLNNGTNPSLWICSAHNVTALLGTDNITVTFPATSGRAVASADEFSGLVASGNPLDKTKAGSGNTNAPTSGFTAITSQADELLFGAIGFSGTNNATFTTAGSGLCTSSTVGAQGAYTTDSNLPVPNPTGQRGLATEHRIVTQTAPYAACGTLSSANQWLAAIATYKIAVATTGTLKVIKLVSNSHGGTKGAGDFNIHVKSGGSDITGSPQAGSTSGTSYTLNAGSYVVSEDSVTGYSPTFSGDCDSSGNVTVSSGGNATCTITNNDVAPTLKVIKSVNNTHGGGKGESDFSLHVKSSGTDVSGSPQAGSATGTTYTLSAGSYVVSEDSVAGYSGTFSGDCDSSGNVTLVVGDTKSCTITNNDVAPKLYVIKHVVNDNGGTATANQWNLAVSSNNGGTGTGNAAGAESPGTQYTLQAGKQYSVAESGGPSGYAASSAGDCTIASATLGQTYTCTITNDDIAPKLNVIKHVINDNGGTATANQWNLAVSSNNGGGGTGSAAGAESPGTQYTLQGNKQYSVAESGGPFGYAESDSADCSIANAALGATYTCTITNDDIQPTITVTKAVVPASDPGRFNLLVNGVVKASNVGDTGTTGSIGVSAPTTTIAENTTGVSPATNLANYTTTIDCGQGPVSGTSATVSTPIGTNTFCTITNTIKDADGDGIPDFLDCTPTVPDDLVVDPNGVLAAYLPPSRRYSTLQAAVNAASDNYVISMYADTTENVTIGGGASAGKDLRIIGCGHKITSAAPINTNPVITVLAGAGAAGDASNASGAEKDIQIEDLNVLKGSYGFLVQTTTAPAGGHVVGTLLKSIRSDTNKLWGISISGEGNEVRGANSVGTNLAGGIQVTANNNLLRSNRVASNGSGSVGDGINVTGNNNTIIDNTIGGKGVGNKGRGIYASGTGNIVHDNDVEANGSTGIYIMGNNNQVYKNDVGDKGTGNGAGGIYINGSNNMLGMALNQNDVFGNTGIGMQIVGNNNVIANNDVGDDGKGNTSVGIDVNGYGNTVDSNNVFENGSHGINVNGGTTGSPNVISNNSVGDRGKGNLGDGIMVGAVADSGNGAMNPVEIIGNTVRSNKLNGIEVKTYLHQLANNVSGGTGTYASGGQDNGKCEFLVAGSGANVNFNAGGNVANGTTIPGAMNSTFPNTCQGTP